MTKAAAIYQFWSGFGLTAYEENTVPTDATFPYITYQLTTDSLGYDVAGSASLWYKEDSWVTCNAKAEQIAQHIGFGGKIIKFDGGRIWIKRGSPFAQNMGDESDDLIKRKYMNVVYEFFSAT